MTLFSLPIFLLFLPLICDNLSVCNVTMRRRKQLTVTWVGMREDFEVFQFVSPCFADVVFVGVFVDFLWTWEAFCEERGAHVVDVDVFEQSVDFDLLVFVETEEGFVDLLEPAGVGDGREEAVEVLVFVKLALGGVEAELTHVVLQVLQLKGVLLICLCLRRVDGP